MVDEHVIISSANLTDDALNRNIELGTLSGAPVADMVWQQFERLGQTVLARYAGSG